MDWADVLRKGCFGWEYKGRDKNLDVLERLCLAQSGTRSGGALRFFGSCVFCIFRPTSIRVRRLG